MHGIVITRNLAIWSQRQVLPDYLLRSNGLVLRFLQSSYFLEIKRLRNLLILFLVPLVVYYALFTIHFSLLQKPGPGDAFMKPTFHSESTWHKFIDLNKEMYTANARLIAGHPYRANGLHGRLCCARSTTGTTLRRAQGKCASTFSAIPVVWWASTFGIIYVIMSSITIRKRSSFSSPAPLPPQYTAVYRYYPSDVLYHYFTSLIIAILALMYLIDQQKPHQDCGRSCVCKPRRVSSLFPLTYGTYLTEDGFQARAWLCSWDSSRKNCQK